MVRVIDSPEERPIEQTEKLEEQIDVANNRRLNHDESALQALRREKLDLLRRLDELNYKELKLPVRSLHDKFFLSLIDLLIVLQVSHHAHIRRSDLVVINSKRG
jgi:hypothetical protein